MALGGRRSVNQRQHEEHDDLWATCATSYLYGEEAWFLSNRQKPERRHLPPDRSITEFGHALQRVKHFRNFLRLLIA